MSDTTTNEDREKTNEQLLENARNVLLTMPDLRKVNSLRFGEKMCVELLCLINELLPKLEVLETQCNNDNFSMYQGESINFKHVNQLTVHISGVGIQPNRIPFTFERLENLILIGYSRQSEKWTDFIVENKQLKTLTLVPGLCILSNENMDQHLMRFAVELPQLAELFVYGDFISSPDRLLQFIAECKNLVKIHLRFLYSNQETQGAFGIALQSEWSVTKLRMRRSNDVICNDLVFEKFNF